MALGWSTMTYGIVSWGKSSLTYINKIQSAQDRLIKLIYGSCSSDIYKRHRLLTFKDAFYYFACTKLYKEINEPVLKYFSERLEGFSVNHEHSTRFRTSNSIVPPLFYRSKCQNSFIYQAIVFWNSIPVDVRNSRNCRIFKSKLKVHLLENHDN